MASQSAPQTISATPVAWVPTLIAGLMVGFLEVILAISFASLIFSGPLENELARGIGMALVTGIIHLALAGLFSSIKGMVGTIQDSPSVLLAVAAGGLAGAGYSLPTIITVIVLSALFSGIGLMLLGQFRLGDLVRYLPYPVIGGFLAGTGWLLAQGSIGTMASYGLEPGTIQALLTPEQIRLWLPGVLFAFALFFGLRMISHVLVLPGLLIGGMVLYYVWLALSGLSIQAATDQGLLLGSLAGAAELHPFPLADLTGADWGVVLMQGGTILTIIGLTAVTLLLNMSGIELAVKQEMDLNHELRLYGLANILTGIVGGMIGFPTTSLTGLVHRIGAGNRWVGVIGALICAAVLVFGSNILAYLPKAIVGGLLLFIGLDFLSTWLVDQRKRLGWADYAVIWLILFVIAVQGFLAGVAAGLVCTVLLFAVNYSRLNIVHRVSDCRTYTSHVQRGPQIAQILYDLGEETYVIELSGFIFFGTANRLVETVRNRLSNPAKPKVKMLIIDGRHINGLDSSSAFSFQKVQQFAAANQVELILSSFRPELIALLTRSGLAQPRVFNDLDHALEWTEEVQLATQPVPPPPNGYIIQQLVDMGMEERDINTLQSYLEPKTLAANEVLIEEGTPSDDMYFIASGRVSVYIKPQNSPPMRLFTLGPGMTCGELGFVLDEPRNAAIIADEATRVLRVSREMLDRIKAENPELMFIFQRTMLKMIASRLVLTNNKLVAVAEMNSP